MGYLCVNFGLPRPLCSLRPDVRDRRQTDRRQTDVRQKHRLMPPPIRGGDITRRIVEKLRSQFAVLTGRTTAYDVTDGKVRYSATITVLE